jgi:hypothetical protein
MTIRLLFSYISWVQPTPYFLRYLFSSTSWVQPIFFIWFYDFLIDQITPDFSMNWIFGVLSAKTFNYLFFLQHRGIQESLTPSVGVPGTLFPTLDWFRSWAQHPLASAAHHRDRRPTPGNKVTSQPAAGLPSGAAPVTGKRYHNCGI